MVFHLFLLTHTTNNAKIFTGLFMVDLITQNMNNNSKYNSRYLYRVYTPEGRLKGLKHTVFPARFVGLGF